MNNQYLIIYQFSSLFEILKELEGDINFKVIDVKNDELLNNEVKKLQNYLIITKKKSLNFDNQYFLDNFPIKLLMLIEKLNIELLKKQFNNQSEINIDSYKINLNSREMSSKIKRLKLTEKEVNTILYLSTIGKPVSIDELQTNVWGYQLDTETHTVETHIYRLRKKIYKTFADNNFLISKKNGYQIK